MRNVLAEYEVAWNGHDTADFSRLFTEDCDDEDPRVHWKGVQGYCSMQDTEPFRKRLKTAVRKLTGVEVRFSTPDVALVHATRGTSLVGVVPLEGCSSSEIYDHGDGQNEREAANHVFSEHGERGLKQSKEQNLLIRVYDHTGNVIENARAQRQFQNS